MRCNPSPAACWSSATASSTWSIGISAAGTSRSGAMAWISETSHSFSAWAASRMSCGSSMSDDQRPIDWYITSPQMPSSSRSFRRRRASRDPGGRWDISAIVSPVAPFAVMSLGSFLVKLFPSTSTSSSSSLIIRVRGMRSACFFGRIWCQRSAGSRKCESPEWAQILSLMRSNLCRIVEQVNRFRRNRVPKPVLRPSSPPSTWDSQIIVLYRVPVCQVDVELEGVWMRLQDKVIVITGSGSGLGREGALLFAGEGAVIVTSDLVPGRAQKVAKEIDAAGGTAVAIDADVRSEDDMRRLVQGAVAAHGRVDVMWANAGIPEPGFGLQQFTDSRLEDWNNIFATNVTGIYLAWREAAKHMVERDSGGTLLATTSASAFLAYPGFPMYGASKAAANGLVRAAALELGKFGIRANALCPTHGMSINFALPPEAEVLGKSYEEMQPWDADA